MELGYHVMFDGDIIASFNSEDDRDLFYNVVREQYPDDSNLFEVYDY